jgi:hypothetical protein
MRIVLVIACAAAFAFSAWSNISTTADAKQRTNSSINPLAMTVTTTDLPMQQFDAY